VQLGCSRSCSILWVTESVSTLSEYMHNIVFPFIIRSFTANTIGLCFRSEHVACGDCVGDIMSGINLCNTSESQNLAGIKHRCWSCWCCVLLTIACALAVNKYGVAFKFLHMFLLYKNEICVFQVSTICRHCVCSE
jgi:hypothetical protein